MRPRVVLVHGFTQTRRSWDAVVAALGGGVEVAAVDVAGHGAAAGERPPFAGAAARIGETGGEASYVGYSMGGRLVLRLALDRPDLVRSLVLIGASPGIADPAEREARRRADESLAEEVLRLGTDAFLERWLAQPLLAGTVAPRDEVAARRENRPEGLAYALRSLGTGAQEPLWDRLGELRMPVLLVAGADDAKFRGIAERMAAGIGSPARTAWVPGAGHAVPLEQPSACARLIHAHAATR